MKRYMGILFLLVVFVFNLSAGWLIKMSESGQVQNIYFEGTKMAVKDGQNHIIFDVKSGNMIMVNQLQKKYWEGNVDDFAKMIEETMAQGKKQMSAQMDMMKEQMKNMPPAQQEMMKKMFAMQEEKESAPVKVSVKKTGSEKVKKISCDKYDIFVNGELTEKLWLSDDLPFYSDYKDGKFQEEMMKMQSKFEKVSGGMEYKATKKYLELVSSKIIVKSKTKEPEIMGGGDNWMTSEYISSEKMNVDKYLNVPSGYTKALLNQLMFPQGMPQPGVQK